MATTQPSPPVDRGLQASMDKVQEILKTLPHGEAQKLEDAVHRLYMEATWLQTQRDRARAELAERNAYEESA